MRFICFAMPLIDTLAEIRAIESFCTIYAIDFDARDCEFLETSDPFVRIVRFIY